MEEEHVKLLKRALDLYEFVLEQRQKESNDSAEMNEFSHMKEELEKLTGFDLF